MGSADETAPNIEMTKRVLQKSDGELLCALRDNNICAEST